MRTFTKDTALSEHGRGAAWHVWINGSAWQGNGRGTVCYMWIGLNSHLRAIPLAVVCSLLKQRAPLPHDHFCWQTAMHRWRLHVKLETYLNPKKCCKVQELNWALLLIKWVFPKYSITNSEVFLTVHHSIELFLRAKIPDAVWIQFFLLKMGMLMLETCRG